MHQIPSAVVLVENEGAFTKRELKCHLVEQLYSSDDLNSYLYCPSLYNADYFLPSTIVIPFCF